ncbi:uncharacterized protein LOC134190969 isoform X2 [Corticium candelabrum]|uniref:uncharacterized protein LOC134190969 isoform X2 n=1 Tax=Corticium candelabrum TaxID=121492 RepID=UPI002E254FE2|nr:uncharacterized protein LOC134190969 isoform X2 [Corticium candelabrum]
MLLSWRSSLVLSSRRLFQSSIRMYRCDKRKTQSTQYECPHTLKSQISLRKYRLLNPFIELDVRQGWNELLRNRSKQGHVIFGRNVAAGDRVSKSCRKQLLMNSRDFGMSMYAISSSLAGTCQDFEKPRGVDTTSSTIKHYDGNDLSNNDRNTQQASLEQSTVAISFQGKQLDKLQTSRCCNSQLPSSDHVPEIISFAYNALQRKENEESSDMCCLYAQNQNRVNKPLADPSWMKATPTQLSVALLKLREELPAFFNYPPRLEMYSRNLVVENGLMGLAITTRFCASIRFAHPVMEILKMTKESEQSSIHVRWRVRGMPLIRLVGVKAQERMWDGFSIFEVGSDGLIRKHRITRVTPSQLKEKEKTRFIAFLMGFWQLGRKRGFC